MNGTLKNRLSLIAPAKINHFLYVNGRLDDGYHHLQTLMQFIDLEDVIHIDKRDDKKITATMDGVPQRDNLVLKAANLLAKNHSIPFGVDIHIEKTIPMGAGLGGGSSDAATTLIALNKIWDINLKRVDLAQQSLAIGADVPLFIFGENAIAEGKGEKLTAVNLPNNLFLVINPGVHVNTSEIFSDSRLTRSAPIKTIRELFATQWTNDLESVAKLRHSEVGAAIDWLSSYGDAKMSGSGSSVFLVLDDIENGRRILNELPTNWTGHIVQGLPQHPLRDWSL